MAKNIQILIKDLKETHPAIYDRALECQEEQKFRKNDALSIQLAFEWVKTKENASRINIWGDVSMGKFQSFYDFHKIPNPELNAK